MVRRDSKVDNFADSLFFLLLIIIRSSLLAGIRWSVCMLKSHRSLCVSFSRTDAGLCIYYYYYYYYYYYFIPSEFFAPTLTGGFYLESEWQQVSSGLQDSFGYSGRSQQCCSRNGSNSPTNFQFLLFLLQTLGDHSECTNYSCYYLDSYSTIVLVLWQSLRIYFSFHFSDRKFSLFYFHSMVRRNGKINKTENSLSFLLDKH